MLHSSATKLFAEANSNITDTGRPSEQGLLPVPKEDRGDAKKAAIAEDKE